MVGTRINSQLKNKLEQKAKKKNINLSALINQILDQYINSNTIDSNQSFLENLKVIVPDLKKQQEEMHELKKSINSLIGRSEEAYDHISDMKRGEGFYFKTIYETLKEQKEAFNTLSTTEDTKKISTSSLSEIRKKMGLKG